MTSGYNTLNRFLFLPVIIASFFISVFPANAKETAERSAIGGVYQSTPASIDYRDVTILNEYVRMVYKNRWNDINVDDLLAQLQNFRGAAHSPAMREIWRDLLLSDFSGLKIRNDKQQAVLMAERLHLLNELGFFDEAVRLYQEAATRKPIYEAIARQGVESMALAGSADGACLEVTMASKDLKGDHWDQDNALCAAYFGEKERAAELYEKTKDTAGSGFRTVYKLLNSNSAKTIQIDIPALWRTLLLAKGASVPGNTLKSADRVILASLAANPKVPLSVRMAAASRGADLGTVGSDRLRALYEAQYPEDADLASTVSAAESGGSLSSAAYYASARFTFEGNARSRIVKNAMHRTDPITSIKNQVYVWIVDKLTLQVKKLGWFAPEAYSLMVATNRVQSANMYYESGNLKKSPFNLIHALVTNEAWSAEDQTLWQEAMKKKYKGKAEDLIQDYTVLAKAYDQEDKLGLWVGRKERDLSINRDSILYQSVKRGGRGLTLVNALNVLAAQKTISSVQTPEFVDIIETMTKEGLFGERKKITLEFLIQNML